MLSSGRGGWTFELQRALQRNTARGSRTSLWELRRSARDKLCSLPDMMAFVLEPSAVPNCSPDALDHQHLQCLVLECEACVRALQFCNWKLNFLDRGEGQ